MDKEEQIKGIRRCWTADLGLPVLRKRGWSWAALQGSLDAQVLLQLSFLRGWLLLHTCYKNQVDKSLQRNTCLWTWFLETHWFLAERGFHGGSDSKESSCNAEYPGLMPWSSPGDPMEKGMATYAIILSWSIPWTEESGSYSPWGNKESDMTEWLTHLHYI